MKIITISREFGSGGRELGKRLADELGIPCYDHQIIEMIAKENGFDERYVANVGEKSIEAAYPMTIGHSFAMPPIQLMDQPIRVAAAQRQIIENFAKQGDCVIVGRCADYILKDRPDCLHIFIHADMEHRAARVRERYGETKQPMEKRLQEKDSKRKIYYKHYTNRNWGEAENYDICLDSGKLGVDKCVEIVCDIAQMK